MTKKFEHNRARTEILHHVLSFCITHDWEPEQQYGRKSPAYSGFTPIGYGADSIQPEVGDLVILASAPATKWTIGWLVEIEKAPSGYDTRYCIESLDDGSQCWWSNVGLSIFPRKNLNPRWRWTDRQFAFQKKWHRTYYKHGDDKPNQCVFHDDGSVTIGERGYWDFSLSGDDRPAPIERTFPDWKKTTIPMLVEAVKEMTKERAARRAVEAL